MALTKDKPYSMSFSTGALYLNQSILFAELFDGLTDWQRVREKVLAENLLQARTQNTANRVCSEIISRLKRLTAEQFQVLVDGPTKDSGHILWAAVCKRYSFIRDFAIEVVHEKFLQMDLLLTPEDYLAFFNQKAEWHEEVSQVKESTQKKLRQVLFKMLREAELLSAKNRIIPVILSPGVCAAILDDPELTLAIYPAEDSRGVM